MESYTKKICCIMLVVLVVLAWCGSANAHKPHDVHTFVALSPNFSVDSTLFITQKQGPSPRPHVSLASRDKGQTWKQSPAGMDNLSRFTSAMASPLYATDKTVFMTTLSDGVYRSVDGGRSWAKANQGLTTLRLSDSAASLDAAGNVVLFVSGTGGGLFRSGDLGESWEEIIPIDVAVSAFAVSPAFSVDRMVLAGDSSGMLYLSQDGGTTFAQYGLFADLGKFKQFVFSPDYQTSGALFIGMSTGLYRSHDFGRSFMKLNSFGSELVSALALSPTYGSDSTLFAATPAQGVFKSTDSGLTWDLHETGIPLVGQTHYHFMDLQVSDNFANDGIVFLATFEGLFRSDDGGLSWIELETRPLTLIMEIDLSPDFAQDGLMLVGTYGGGLYVSQDAGTNWDVSNTGLTDATIYQVKITKGAGNEPVLLASEQNQALISLNRGASWVQKEVASVLPNDCLPSALDAAPPMLASDQPIFLGCRKDGLVMTHDGGDTWETSVSPAQMSGRSLTSVKLSPNFKVDKTVFLADTQGRFARSRDGGNSWQGIPYGQPSSGYWFGGTSIAVSPNFAADNYIIAATSKGFYSSQNAGDSWARTPDTTSPVASGIIEYVEFSPYFNEDNTIVASVRGRGLFRSNNAGINWEQIGAGLLENGYQLTGFAFSPNFAQDGVIIGHGHDHLFRSTDRGDSFELFDIPFVRHEDSRKQSVHFKGDWGQLKAASASARNVRYTWMAGDEVSLTFYGTGVRWVGYRADILGAAEVYIDNERVDLVDQYSPTTLAQQVLYSVDNLPLGQHEIRVVATNLKNPATRANITIVDAFDVIR